MVAKEVEIITKSYKDEPAAHWRCDGSPEYELKKADKKERGTEIILHIDKDSKEFFGGESNQRIAFQVQQIHADTH